MEEVPAAEASHGCAWTVMHSRALSISDYQLLTRHKHVGSVVLEKPTVTKRVKCNLGVRQNQACLPALPCTG